MIIKKKYDIQQPFEYLNMDGEHSIHQTKQGMGQLVSIDIIPSANFYVIIDPRCDTDEKYCLMDMEYGMLFSRGTGYNEAINKAIDMLTKYKDQWDQIVEGHLDKLPYYLADVEFPLNEFE